MKTITHALLFSVILLPLVWGIYGYFKTKKEQHYPAAVEKRTAGILVINMAVLYALAYNIIFFIQELFLALGKKWLGLTAYLYNNNHNWEGTHPMTALAQGYGAVAIFLCGLIFFFIYHSTKRSSHWTNVLWLWLAFQGLAQSIPQFITAKMIPDTDTGQAFTYLNISEGQGLFISFTGVVALLFIGTKMSAYLIRLAPARELVNSGRKRFGYLFRAAVLASLLGVILIVPFLIMPWERAMNPFFLTINVMPVIFSHGWKVKVSSVQNNVVNKKILLLPIILLMILLLFFQLILSKGVTL